MIDRHAMASLVLRDYENGNLTDAWERLEELELIEAVVVAVLITRTLSAGGPDIRLRGSRESERRADDWLQWLSKKQELTT